VQYYIVALLTFLTAVTSLYRLRDWHALEILLLTYLLTYLLTDVVILLVIKCTIILMVKRGL